MSDPSRRHRHPSRREGRPDMDTAPHELEGTRRHVLAPRAVLPGRRQLAGAPTGLPLLPLLTLVMHEVLGGVLIPASVMLSYLVAVVIVGLVGGRLPALAAAVAAGSATTPSSPSTPSPSPIRTTWWPWSRSSSPAPWARRSAWPPAGRRKRRLSRPAPTTPSEIARGIRPANLSQGGLVPALRI